jgi:hypothetical protein
VSYYRATACAFEAALVLVIGVRAIVILGALLWAV